MSKNLDYFFFLRRKRGKKLQRAISPRFFSIQSVRVNTPPTWRSSTSQPLGYSRANESGAASARSLVASPRLLSINKARKYDPSSSIEPVVSLVQDVCAWERSSNSCLVFWIGVRSLAKEGKLFPDWFESCYCLFLRPLQNVDFWTNIKFFFRATGDKPNIILSRP